MSDSVVCERTEQDTDGRRDAAVKDLVTWVAERHAKDRYRRSPERTVRIASEHETAVARNTRAAISTVTRIDVD